MFQQVLAFIKYPVYVEDEHKDFAYRWRMLLKLLILGIGLGLFFSVIQGILEEMGFVNLDEHAMQKLVEEETLPLIFVLVVFAAPLIEETIFRAPMVLFRESPLFRPIFYLLTFLFGFIHITNFQMTAHIIWLSPILVAPQICIGFLLGFIRVRLGFLWALALHALYNFVLATPILVTKLFDLPLE